MNDFYAKDTSKKIRSVKHKNAKQGLFMGRYAPFGFDKSREDKHKLVINEESAKVIRQIFDLFLEGNSPLQISYILKNKKVKTPSQLMNMQKQTNIWYPEVIRRILKNEMYIGNMVQCRKRKINYKLKKIIDMPKEDWIIVNNTHEAIIEKEKFYAVQEIMKSKEKTRIKSTPFLLKGLIVCKECGKKMTTTADNKGNHTRYLRCTSYATAPLQKLCTPHIINYQKLENKIINQIRKNCNEYLNKNNGVFSSNSKSTLKNERTILLKSIKVLETQIDKIYEDKLNGIINDEDFKRIYNKKNKEKENKKNRLKILENIEFNRKTKNYKDILNDFLKEDKISIQILNSLIDKIEINNNKQIKIYYKFDDLNNLS
ncbi:MAG: recombinase family protein [Candidatus Scatovivens sp.]